MRERFGEAEKHTKTLFSFASPYLEVCLSFVPYGDYIAGIYSLLKLPLTEFLESTETFIYGELIKFLSIEVLSKLVPSSELQLEILYLGLHDKEDDVRAHAVIISFLCPSLCFCKARLKLRCSFMIKPIMMNLMPQMLLSLVKSSTLVEHISGVDFLLRPPNPLSLMSTTMRPSLVINDDDDVRISTAEV